MAVKKTAQTDAILRLTHANVHLARGAAGAAKIGLDNFFKKLEHENVLSPDLNLNGFLAGAVAGWAAAMQEGAKLADEAFRLWMGTGSNVNPPPPRPAKKTSGK
jgi:hypothetical protein